MRDCTGFAGVEISVRWHPRRSSAHPHVKIPELSSPFHLPPFIKNNSLSLFRYSCRVFPRPHMTIACVFLVLHISRCILAHVFHLHLTLILILICTSHRSLVLSSLLIDAIARVRSIVARHRERTFTQHSDIRSSLIREHVFTRARQHTSSHLLTYRPARSIRARAR